MFGRMTLAFLLFVASQNVLSQNVTTWHNDYNRTGWQQNEQTLTQSSFSPSGTFGLLWQWILPDQYSSGVNDQAYAQPLAVAGLSNVGTCSSNCNVLFVATEQDYLYAFQADSSSQTRYGLLISQRRSVRILDLSIAITFTRHALERE